MKKQKRINKRISFIGAGNMAEALIASLVKSGIVSKTAVTITDVRGPRLAELKKKYGVNVVTGNRAAVEKGDIIFLAVKPQQMADVVSEIASDCTREKLIVSIAAGVTTKNIEHYMPQGVPVVRTMPNLPVLSGMGAVGVSKGRWARAADIAHVVSLLSTAGTVVELPESKLDAVTALSGSGPAYVFYLAEIMEQAGIEMGLDKKTATRLARATIAGAGKMLMELAEPAGELRRRVTSPGGTTEAAMNMLETHKVKAVFVRAILRACQRAGELRK